MAWRSTCFRVVAYSLALGVIASLFIGLAKLWDWVQPPGNCTHAIVDSRPSPDGAWTAIDDEYTCEGGFSIVVTAEIHLMTTIDPARDVVVLGVDTGGNDDERPRFAWTSSNVLQVTVPLNSYMVLSTRQVEGVHVDLHFDPDDPAARAAWLKETNQDPDPADDSEKPR
jgi:hypothetical protein